MILGRLTMGARQTKNAPLLPLGHFTPARYEGALRKVLSRTRDWLQKFRGLAKWLKVWQNWSKLLVGFFSSKTKFRILTSLPLFFGFFRTLSYLVGLLFVNEERTATLVPYVFTLCMCNVFVFCLWLSSFVFGTHSRIADERAAPAAALLRRMSGPWNSLMACIAQVSPAMNDDHDHHQ